MTERAFDILQQQLNKGDNTGLRTVYEQCQMYCIRTLQKKTNCSTADAEDIFMDALLIFRENVLSGKLQQLTNLKTYVFGICWNLWRDLNYARKRWTREQNEVERQLYMALGSESKGLSSLEVAELKAEADRQIGIVQQALNQLKESCQKLLKMVYLEKRRYAEVAKLMGFASESVVKVTKYRCYKGWVKELEKIQHHGGGIDCRLYRGAARSR